MFVCELMRLAMDLVAFDVSVDLVQMIRDLIGVLSAVSSATKALQSDITFVPLFFRP